MIRDEVSNGGVLPDGTPLDLLFERPDLPRLALPAALSEAYGGGFGLESPRVVANFVASADGVVALPDAEESGGIVSGGAAADRFVMGLLRGCATAIVVGAGTFRKATDDAFTAESIYPGAASLFTAARRALGLETKPRVFVVTDSGMIDLRAAARVDATIVTAGRGAAHLQSQATSPPRMLRVPGEHARIEDVVAALRRETSGVLLTEGGPTFFAELVKAGAVDELFVTTSPFLFGRKDGDGRRGLTDGLDLERTELSLSSVRRHGSLLFSRYEVSSRKR